MSDFGRVEFMDWTKMIKKSLLLVLIEKLTKLGQDPTKNRPSVCVRKQ